MRRMGISLAMSASLGLGVAACTQAQITAATPTVDTVITSIQDALNSGVLPAKEAEIASLVLTGLRGLVSTETAVAGQPTEAQVLANLKVAVTQLQSDVTVGSPTANDAAQALTLINELQENQTGTTKVQVEGALGLVMADYLQTRALSAAPGSAVSAVQMDLDEARTAALKLKG